jgi:hypothetical protein
MIFTVRVTDGHCFRDVEIETDKGVEEACLLAMDRATEIDRGRLSLLLGAVRE